MKAHQTETTLMLLASLVLAVSSRAQTNRASVMRPVNPRVARPPIVATRVATNAGPNLATVKFTLPKELSSYHVLEERAHVTRAVTNLAATPQNEVQASLAAGSTLMFMEKESPEVPNRALAERSKRLFSTYILKATAAARPGREPDTASGELSMYTDTDPTPWDSTSNKYIAHLSVVFSTGNTAPNHPLLPMTVVLSGQNVKSIDPRSLELEKANAVKEAVVTCDAYQADVQITAHYLTASNNIALHLQKLTPVAITQMIISKPMLFAALTGGLIGGLLRLLKGARGGITRILHYLAEGVTVGLVTVTLLLSGLLHSQIAELSSQPQLVLAFALAAAAGSVGAHFLDKTIKPLLGK